MLKKTVNLIAVFLMITQPVMSHADGTGKAGPKQKDHGCTNKDDRMMIEKIVFKQKDPHFADILKRRIEERNRPRYRNLSKAARLAEDKKFCAALRDSWDNKDTEARYECMMGNCKPDTPVTADVQEFRDVTDHVPRAPRIRPATPAPFEDDLPAPRETAGGGGGGAGSLLSSPFMGALLGGALGGLVGGYLGGRMGGQHQQRQMFTQPQWGGQWGNQAPGFLPYPTAPNVLPYGGAGNFNSPYALPLGQNAWAQPYLGGVNNQFAGGYNQYGAGLQYGGAYGSPYGGGYGRVGPSVLPLAPQSSQYSVGDSIPQNHWNLINVGR